MKKYWPAFALVVLLVLCLAAWYATRAEPSGSANKKRLTASTASPVDPRLLQTAHVLADSADTSDEQALAREALRLSNHEVDQAFASALRDAEAETAPSKPPFKQLSISIRSLKTSIALDQDRIAKLAKAAANSDTAAEEREMAEAQLALDQDSLADAQEDLARLGGDQHAAIERAMQEHQAADGPQAAPLKFPAATPTVTLSEQARTWFALRNRANRLGAADQAAAQKAASLGAAHAALEATLEAQPAPGTGALARLRRMSEQRKALASFDKQIQDCQQLAEVYQRWGGVVQARLRAVLHALLLSFTFVLAILLAVVVVDSAIRQAFARNKDRRRTHQLQVVAVTVVRIIGALSVLMIVFGPPNQVSTIIGLATAGLTVALKDYVVAFFGWFALIGRNGMRVGDWVEIEGVGGEVIEIGLLKTVLLEMGTVTNAGHPTGRRVTFVNKFAIENHYFNFSTAGQWLWDELRMTLPAAGDPYRMALEIREKVEHETAAEAVEAEKEWERATHTYGTRAFSAKPMVDLRPSVNGLEVVVRYITRAPHRYEAKSHLFQTIVDLIHKPAV